MTGRDRERHDDEYPAERAGQRVGVVGQALHAERHGVTGGAWRGRGSAVVAEFVEATECRYEVGGAVASGGVVVGAQLLEQFDAFGEAGDQASLNGLAQRVERDHGEVVLPACVGVLVRKDGREFNVALIGPVLTTTQSERPGTQESAAAG